MRIARFLLGKAVFGVGLLGSALAHAEPTPAASPTGKGLVGGALLGAEVVLLAESALAVRPGWAYWVFGGAGAVGGGALGYLVEQGNDARASVLLLAGGMALSIPTIVAVLSATSYEPPRDYVQDQGPSDEPLAEPPQPSPPGTIDPSTAPVKAVPAAPPAPRPSTHRKAPVMHERTFAPARLSPSFLAWQPHALTLNVPAIEVRNLYTLTEMATWGVKQGTEVRVPVLSVLF